MSYPNTTSEETFTGNGVTTSFAYTQNTPSAADVHVYFIGTAGPPIKLTNGTHFDLAGVGLSGGITVTIPKASSPPAPYNVALTSTQKLVVWVEPPANQEFSHKNNDTYAPSVLEQRLDDQVRVMQKLRADVDRCLKVELGSALDPTTVTFEDFARQKKLLADVTVSNTATLPLRYENWPASFDVLEIEFLGVGPPTSAGALQVTPIANGAALTGLNSVGTVTPLGAGTIVTSKVLDEWRTNGSATAVGRGAWGTARIMYDADDQSLRFYADWILHLFFSSLPFGLHTWGATIFETPITRPDGCDLSIVGQNITGRAKLWGLPTT